MRIIISHMRERPEGIEQRQRVEAGSIIGALGNTGVSTGPHIDLMVRTDGVNYPDRAGGNVLSPRLFFALPLPRR
jgi:murein DD-endopeptidase MepM/ murein hydrolase activator NlpD